MEGNVLLDRSQSGEGGKCPFTNKCIPTNISIFCLYIELNTNNIIILSLFSKIMTYINVLSKHMHRQVLYGT